MPSDEIHPMRAQIHLTAEQASILSAIERVAAAISIEAAQLRGLWNQPAAAKTFENVALQFHQMREGRIREWNGGLIIAKELPPHA